MVAQDTRPRTSSSAAFREFAKLEWPVGQADQAIDDKAEMFEHALDLAILALAQAIVIQTLAPCTRSRLASIPA